MAVHRVNILKGLKMTRLKSPLGLLTLVLLVTAAVMAGPGLGQNSAEPKGGDWKNVTIIYGTDVKGKIEPCG